MSHLVPCPSCARHVRTSEAQCPFCAGSLESVADTPAPKMPNTRLGRAAQFAFGAAVATSMTVSACGDGEGPNDPVDAAARQDSGAVSDSGASSDSGAATDSGVANDSGGLVALYGAVPLDSGMPDASASSDGGAAPDSGGFVALYGAVPPPDSGAAKADVGVDSGSTAIPAYGAPAIPESRNS